MTVAVLKDRLEKAQQKRIALIAQVNILLGREAELTELIAVMERPADHGAQ